MAIENPDKSLIDLTALVHARELSEAEFRAAIRDIGRNLRWRKPPLPTIGEVLRQRKAAKERK